MLPKYLKILPEDNSSIQVRHERCAYFDNPWHFHPELELNLIVKSAGTRFVGDSILSFKENDLVLLGPNLPHFWKNDERYYQNPNDHAAEAIVIRFSEFFIGKDQYKLPEFKRMEALFEMAGKGLLIEGEGKERVINSVKKMVDYQGMERLIIFLGVLNAISQTCKLSYLSSEGFMTSLRPKDEKRMNNIYDFITNNFREKLSLEQIAAKASMNASAFSRYFSQHTGKSVTGFLQELRIGYACKLLMQKDLSISEVMNESGFQNQAYFNKLFAERLGMTPKDYRHAHNKKPYSGARSSG